MRALKELISPDQNGWAGYYTRPHDAPAFLWRSFPNYGTGQQRTLEGVPKHVAGLLGSSAALNLIRQMTGKSAIRQSVLMEVPIPEVNSEVANLINKLVDYHIGLLEAPKEMARDAVIAPFFHRMVDALAFEAYYPQELHENDRWPHHVLSKVAWKEDKPRELFSELWKPTHEVRKLLFFLDSVPKVRQIFKANR